MESNAYQLRDWLRLLPFASPASAIPDILKVVPEAQQTPDMLLEVVSGLGKSPQNDCADVLLRIAENYPDFYSDYNWKKTVMGLGGSDITRRLVDFTLSGKMSGQSRAEWDWINGLSGLLKQQPEARSYVHDILKDGPKNTEQNLLAHALAQNPTPEDVLVLVKAERASGRSFLDSRSIESAVTVHVVSEEWRGAFNIVPVPATALRRDLLALTTDGSRADPAGRCLTEIDKVRDRYGAPESEPRHPNLPSGRPWPIVTADPDAESCT